MGVRQGWGGWTEASETERTLVGPARYCPFRPPPAHLLSPPLGAGLTDLNPRVAVTSREAFALESSLETHIVFTMVGEEYVAMSAGAPRALKSSQRWFF